MKTQKKSQFMVQISAIVFAVLFSMTAQAQNTVQNTLYNGYILNSETIQKQAVTLAEEAFQANSKDLEKRYQLLEAQYVLLSGTMATQNEDLFDEYVDDAEKNAKAILKVEKNHPETNALLSSIYGFKIAYSPMKGMFLGGKSSSLLENATANNPKNPVAWLKYAGSKYNTPEMWGGDKEEARKSFKKAVELFEAKPEQLKNNIHYLDALAWLGIAYQQNNELEKARATFEKALAQEPDFSWVQYSLMPNIQKALK